MTEPEQHDALISFGSNLGDPNEQYKQAVINLLRRLVREEIKGAGASSLVAVSKPRVTVSVGGPDGQSPFINGAIRIHTALSAEKLLEVLQGVEQSLGRERIVRWGARRADLDLLLYGREQIETEALIVPHPRMSFRRFVLEPAAEIAGEMIHEPSGLSIQKLLEHLDSKSDLALIVCSDIESFENSPGNSTLYKAMRDRTPEDDDTKSIRVVTTVKRFDQLSPESKLVVIAEWKEGKAEDALLESAYRFAGPTLRIKKCEDLQTELMAAVVASRGGKPGSV